MPRVTWSELIVPNGGIDETDSPQRIAANKWSSALDAEALPDGVRRRRGSSAPQWSALAAGIQMIADFHDSDGSTTRHLVMANGRLYVNSGAAATEVVHAAGALATSNDVHPSWTVGNDRVFMTDDAAVARKFVVVSAVDTWVNDGIDKPTATPTLGTGSGNALADGEWAVDYYYWDDDLGVPSDRRYGDGVGITQTLTSQHLTIDGLPTAVVRSGDRATHIRIETKAPGTTIFRLHKQVTLAAAGSTVTIDSTDTQTVEAEYVHQVSPVHAVTTVAENRRFILNVTDHPYRLQFSAIVGTTPYYESFPTANRRDFGKGDGDYGTALFFVPPRTLVVGFRNSIWAIDPRTPLTSDRFLIAENIGIANWDAGIVVGRTLYFISDAEENKGPYMWTPGSAPQYIQGIDNTFKALELSRLKYASCAHYSPGEDRFQWWTLVTTLGGSAHNRALVYDRKLGSWMVYSLTDLGTVLGEVEVGGASKLFMGSTDGKEYQRDTTSQDDGTNYRGMVTLKAFDFGQAGINKKMRFLDSLLEEQTTGGLSVSIERDYLDKTPINVSVDQTGPGGTFVLGTSTLGSADVLGGRLDVLRRSSARGRAKVFRPTISGSVAWRVKGLTFGLQPTGKR